MSDTVGKRAARTGASAWQVFLQPILLLVFFASSAAPAWADGPHIAFHDTQGSYTVTLFSAPDPLVAGPVDLTLLVQRAGVAGDAPAVDTQALRASCSLALSGQTPIQLPFTPGGTGNSRMLGAMVQLPAPGNYQLQLTIAEKTTASAHFTGTLPVDTNHGRRNTVLFAVFFAMVSILLFLVNQQAKQRLHRRHRA